VEIEVRDDSEAGRYEVLVDGRVAGYADRQVRDGRMVLPHTVVSPALRGQGLAAHMIRRALDDARAQGLAVAPACSYVSAYIAEHPDDLDLVPEPDRPRYGL
jgi:predicted GNAT family acetyltransferase